MAHVRKRAILRPTIDKGKTCVISWKSQQNNPVHTEFLALACRIRFAVVAHARAKRTRERRKNLKRQKCIILEIVKKKKPRESLEYFLLCSTLCKEASKKKKEERRKEKKVAKELHVIDRETPLKE